MDPQYTIQFVKMDIYSLMDKCGVSDVVERGIRAYNGIIEWTAACDAAALILESYDIYDYEYCEEFSKHDGHWKLLEFVDDGSMFIVRGQI